MVPDKEVDALFTHLNSALNKSTYFDTSLVKESTGGGGYYADIMTMKSLRSVPDPREKMNKLQL